MVDYKPLSDGQLVILLKESDHNAFSEIYSRFFGILYIFVQKRIKDEHDAKDILQELFSHIWTKRETLNFSGPLPAYLYTAARHKMLDFIQKHDTQKKYIQELDFFDRHQISSDHLIREKQLAELIEKEINLLPDRMREVFILSRQNNMTYQEIADHLNLSPLSVKSYAKSAIKKLRTRLGVIGYLAVSILFFK